MRLTAIAAYFLSIVAGTIGTAPAAAAVEIFDITGTFNHGSSLSGQLTIDTTSGDVQAAEVIIGAPGSVVYTSFVQSTQFQFISLYFPTPSYLQLLIDAPSLVGYTGGNILSYSDNPYGYITQTFHDHLASGSLSLSATVSVPEPVTWAAMVIGLGMVGAEMRRRRRAHLALDLSGKASGAFPA